MILDAALAPASLRDVPSMAAAAEAVGFGAAWTSETQHDPFLPLGLVAEHTTRLHFGTAVAIGFARSPTVLAHTAWDLAAASGGRFLLGLGTQVRAHIERRFGMAWPESPAGALRELVLSLRAIWKAWQTGERLQFRGEIYKLTLMTPFFSPSPMDTPSIAQHPDVSEASGGIPIYLAGVNRALCRIAGEVADGLHIHPLHSPAYLREVVLPALRDGAEAAGSPGRRITLSASILTVTDASEEDFVRSQIAFYASTPSYRPVMALHGWGDAADRLGGLARQGAWSEMPSVVDSEMLRAFAVVAPRDDLARALRERYDGLVDRVTLYLPFRPGERDAFWQTLANELSR
jgi:probable F420-dependent oxidoreductase